MLKLQAPARCFEPILFRKSDTSPSLLCSCYRFQITKRKISTLRHQNNVFKSIFKCRMHMSLNSMDLAFASGSLSASPLSKAANTSRSPVVSVSAAEGVVLYSTCYSAFAGELQALAPERRTDWRVKWAAYAAPRPGSKRTTASSCNSPQSCRPRSDHSVYTHRPATVYNREPHFKPVSSSQRKAWLRESVHQWHFEVRHCRWIGTFLLQRLL